LPESFTDHLVARGLLMSFRGSCVTRIAVDARQDGGVWFGEGGA